MKNPTKPQSDGVGAVGCSVLLGGIMVVAPPLTSCESPENDMNPKQYPITRRDEWRVEYHRLELPTTTHPSRKQARSKNGAHSRCARESEDTALLSAPAKRPQSNTVKLLWSALANALYPSRQAILPNSRNDKSCQHQTPYNASGIANLIASIRRLLAPMCSDISLGKKIQPNVQSSGTAAERDVEMKV